MPHSTPSKDYRLQGRTIVLTYDGALSCYVAHFEDQPETFGVGERRGDAIRDLVQRSGLEARLGDLTN